MCPTLMLIGHRSKVYDDFSKCFRLQSSARYCISLYNILTIYQMAQEETMTTKIIHEPQLDTILMVEKTIREAESCQTKKQLLQSLPKQVQYQTFNRILNYLESSNKIVYDGRRIVWVFQDNPKLEKLLETSVKLR